MKMGSFTLSTAERTPSALRNHDSTELKYCRPNQRIVHDGMTMCLVLEASFRNDAKPCIFSLISSEDGFFTYILSVCGTGVAASIDQWWRLMQRKVPSSLTHPLKPSCLPPIRLQSPRLHQNGNCKPKEPAKPCSNT